MTRYVAFERTFFTTTNVNFSTNTSISQTKLFFFNLRFLFSGRLVYLVLKCGARNDIKNKKDETPLDCAMNIKVN